VAGHAARVVGNRQSGRPALSAMQAVAMVVSFLPGGARVVWKIGHDTDYENAVSPALLTVILAASEKRFYGGLMPQISIDSLAGPEHPMVGWLCWTLLWESLSIPLGNSALTARTPWSRFYAAETRLRSMARALASSGLRG